MARAAGPTTSRLSGGSGHSNMRKPISRNTAISGRLARPSITTSTCITSSAATQLSGTFLQRNATSQPCYSMPQGLLPDTFRNLSILVLTNVPLYCGYFEKTIRPASVGRPSFMIPIKSIKSTIFS